MSFLPSPNDLLLFVSAAVILLIIPGPAVLYVLARSIDQGRKAGLASCSGIATGTLVHVLGATLGLSALLLSFGLPLRNRLTIAKAKKAKVRVL